MIVITSLKQDPFYVMFGDTFHLSVVDQAGRKEIIVEEITVTKTIDYVASFRFAQEDGTVLGFHLSGFFGDSRNLPDEIKRAVFFDELSSDQKRRFVDSAGMKL